MVELNNFGRIDVCACTPRGGFIEQSRWSIDTKWMAYY